MLLYCHTKTRYLSLWCFTVTQNTVPVRVVLYSHTEARCLSLLYSTATQTHGVCPCGTRLSPRDGRVHVVLSCQPETRDLSLWYSTVLMSHRYTIPVPVVLYCDPETCCLSLCHPWTRYLWYSVVTQRHCTFHRGTQLSHRDTIQCMVYYSEILNDKQKKRSVSVNCNKPLHTFYRK